MTCAALPLPSEAQVLTETPEGRRELARGDIAFFQTNYLRNKYLAHQHRWLQSFRAMGPGQRLLLLAPRAHGKTEALIAFILQLIAEDRNVRILLVTKAAEAARKRLRRIKANLEGNVRLIEDYGTFKPEKLPRNLVGITAWDEEKKRDVQISYWTQHYIYVTRDGDKTDPTVEAVGVGGAVTGGRFDWIFFDDPTDSKQCASPTERKRLREEIYGTYLELLEPWGRAVMIGTRKHHDDCYGTALKDPRFRVIHDRGIVQWPKAFRGVYERDELGRRILVDIEVEGEFEVLCPELWPLARPPDQGDSLLGKYLSAQETVGTLVFLREIQNEVTDDATSQFPMVFFRGGEWRPHEQMPAKHCPGCLDLERSWMHDQFTRDEDGHRDNLVYPWGVLPSHLGLDQADLLVYQCWDLSLVVDKDRAEKHDTDYTVGLTIALDRLTWTRYVVSMYRQRGLHPNTIQRLMWQEYLRFGGTKGHIARVIVESVLFQKVYELQLQASTDMPIIGHATGKEKADPYKGIPGLSALHENGKVRYPYRTPEDRLLTDMLMVEFNTWPDAEHDDILMAEFVGEQRAFMAHAVAQNAEKQANRGRRAISDEDRRRTRR